MRLFRILAVFTFLCLSFGTSFALFSVTDFVTQFQLQEAKLSSSEKEPYYKKVLANLRLLVIKNKDDVQQIKLYTALQAYVSTQIKNF